MTQVRSAVLALGANLGDRLAHLQSAVDALAAAGVAITAASPVVETDPVGGPEQPAYLNAVLLVETDLEPAELLALAHRVEADADRVRTVRWGPRTLDVDLIRVGDLVRSDPPPVLPHPRAAERAFVLQPWLAVDPDAALPGVGPVGDLPAARPVDGVRGTSLRLLLPTEQG